MSVIGILATIASLTIIVLGLPAQIVTNYRRKSCDGLTPSLIYSVCCTYTLWSLYGWTKPDWFLVVAQTPGCVLAFILLFQLFYYRKREERKSAVEVIRKFWQCFFVWHVPPSGEDALQRAEVVLVQSFGLRRSTPGLSNRALAGIARNLHEQYGLPLVLQGEVADCLPDLRQAGVIREHRTPGAYLDTQEVLVQSAEICRANGWRKAVIVAHPDHIWRVARTAEKLGFEVAIPNVVPVPYDALSMQPWTRNRWRFLPRELAARLLYLKRGWI